MIITCASCHIDKEDFEFYFRKDQNKFRSKCKKCILDTQHKNYNSNPRKIKYANDDERKEAARVRAKLYYENNKEKVKQYQSNYSKSKVGRKIISARRKKFNEENPEWWRWKKKYDKSVRRSRETSAGILDLSSIVKLEYYNLNHFNGSSFFCEYCSSVLPSIYDIEHVVPLCKGGTNGLHNLAIVCKECNRGSKGKHSKLLEEWNPDLIKYIEQRNKIL